MKSNAQAQWSGGLKDGKGTISLEGGALTNAPYSFAKRFEGTGAGTTPEELIAGAHAGCFTMALSAALEKAGFKAERLETKATITLVPVDEKPTVTKSELVLNATVPGIEKSKFQDIAETARANCVVSRLLNCEVTLAATLAK